MDALYAALEAYPWGIYVCLLLAPFFQEDAAVIGAASASSLGLGETHWLFAALILGLSASDLWKYWAGRAAISHKGMQKIADRENVQAAKDKVLKRLGHTLMAVRFIPGTRIPVYLASGFFKAPFGRFSAWVVFSGVVYAAIMFTLFHALGEVGGEQVKAIVPFIAIALVAIVIAVQVIRTRWRKRRASEPIAPSDS